MYFCVSSWGIHKTKLKTNKNKTWKTVCFGVKQRPQNGGPRNDTQLFDTFHEPPFWLPVLKLRSWKCVFIVCVALDEIRAKAWYWARKWNCLKSLILCFWRTLFEGHFGSPELVFLENLNSFFWKSWFQKWKRKVGSICFPKYGSVNRGGDRSGVRKLPKSGVQILRLRSPVGANKNKSKDDSGPRSEAKNVPSQPLKTGPLFFPSSSYARPRCVGNGHSTCCASVFLDLKNGPKIGPI